MITSKQNPKIKHIRRLQSSRRFRYGERAFVVEGTRWLTEAVRFGSRLDIVLATRHWLLRDHNQDLLRSLPVNIYEVSDKIMAWASNLESPGGVLAVLPILPRSLPEDPTLVLIADGISDPGNLGTMLRSAAAAGVDGVILAPGCVDAYNPKVVRGSMGAHLQLAMRRCGWREVTEITSDLSRWIAAAGDHVRYDRVDWRSPSALIIGGETSGAGMQARNLTDKRVCIPMQRHTESLNASVATGIILSEAFRQRLDNGIGI